jgi:hypothetical protein
MGVCVCYGLMSSPWLITWREKEIPTHRTKTDRIWKIQTPIGCNCAMRLDPAWITKNCGYIFLYIHTSIKCADLSPWKEYFEIAPYRHIVQTPFTCCEYSCSSNSPSHGGKKEEGGWQESVAIARQLSPRQLVPKPVIPLKSVCAGLVRLASDSDCLSSSSSTSSLPFPYLPLAPKDADGIRTCLLFSARVFDSDAER